MHGVANIRRLCLQDSGRPGAGQDRTGHARHVPVEVLSVVAPEADALQADSLDRDGVLVATEECDSRQQSRYRLSTLGRRIAELASGNVGVGGPV